MHRRRFVALIGLVVCVFMAVSFTVTWAPPLRAEPMFLAYRAHVEGIGWQDWRADPRASGTSGQSLRLEAIELRGGIGTVDAHVQQLGWLPAVSGGATAGTTGRSLRLEGVRVTSDVPGQRIRCQAHVEGIGWLPWVNDGELCGTTGQSRRLEAIRLTLT